MSNYLMHYGVKGMKWGVRKEYVPKGRKVGSQIPASSRREKVSVQKSVQKSKGAFLDFASEYPELTTYATLAAVYVAAFGAKRVSDLNKQKWFTEKYTASDIKRCNTTKEEDLKIINHTPGVSDATLDKIGQGTAVNELSKEEQKAINKAMKDGWFDNCVYCTTAGALRRKGYDVEAKNSPGRGHSHKQTMQWWKGSKVENFYGDSESNPKKVSAFENTTLDRTGKSHRDNATEIAHIEKTLASQGSGSYGDFRVYGLFCGHSVEYSVEKSGVKIYDNQTKQSYNSVKDFFDRNDQFEPQGSTFIRLDTCDPDIDRMLKEHVVKPRGN
mgnify:CR=1 FL=1